MTVDSRSMLLYAVTDRAWLRGRALPALVEDAVRGGATFVQLREKEMEFAAFLDEARRVKAVTDRYHVPFVINDDIEVARACNADGVHIGQGDGSVQEVRRMLGPDKIIGISAHNLEEAAAAEAAGADYLGIGAVFSTSTKKDTVSISSDELRRICSSVSIPTVAIGGITDGNIPLLRNTGIDGVAVVSAIFSAEDPRSAAKKLSESLCSADIGISFPDAFRRLTVRGAIFDVDGTILDSMPMWCSVGSRFLQKNGITPSENIDSQMITRTLEESAAIFHETYGISGTVPEIVGRIIDMVRDDYSHHLQCKPGVRKVIRELYGKGIPLYIATATDRDMIAAAMERLGLTDYFQGIITCGELGMPKTQPDIYLYAAEKLGTRPEETLVFEDVAHAVRSAFSAGFPTISVYDKQSESEREEMRALSVLYLNSYSEWPGIR